MQNTIFEFWKMISEYNCQIIVCLNKDYFQEDGKSRYFPLYEEKTKIFEADDLKFCVSLVENQYENDYNNSNVSKIDYEVIETKVNFFQKLKIFFHLTTFF